MEKFEYNFGYVFVSIKQLPKRLNGFGDDGWEIMKVDKIDQSGSFDSEGQVEYKWELFMKRKK